MGRCSVCGKKGFFLYVNACGRCRKCEKEYRDVEKENRQRVIEIGRQQLEQKKSEILRAKEQLREILEMLILLDTRLYLIVTSGCEKFLPTIEERIDQTYKLREMIYAADKNLYFSDAAREYAYSNEEIKGEDLSGIKQGIKNYIGCDDYDPKHMARYCFYHFALEFEEGWKIEKSEIKKYIKKYGKTIKEPKLSIEATEERVEISDKSKKRNRCGQSFDTMPDCVIVDIETTGLDRCNDSIIEIAGIKIIDSEIVENYSSLIHYDKALDDKIVIITGITTDMVQNCEKNLAEVITEYRDFIGNLPLVGHNIEKFDFEFINRAYLEVFGKRISNRYTDTLILARVCMYDAPSKSLGELTHYAGTFRGIQHRALGDCETTLYLYDYMLKRSAAKLLKWSLRGKAFNGVNGEYPQYIAKRYPENRCHEYHKKLIYSEYMRQADGVETIYAFDLSELKDILSEYSLKKCGSKVELASRIAANVAIDKLNLPVLYIPTEKGVNLIEKILGEDCADYCKMLEALHNQQKLEQEIIAKKQNEKENIEKPLKTRGKNIFQMDDAGNIIAEFDSIAAASKYIGVNSKSIRDAAKGVQKHAGGFCWKYKE